MNLNLVIAEKPSVAKDIANVLGANQKQGRYWAGNGYLVSWCVGQWVFPNTPQYFNKNSLDNQNVFMYNYVCNIMFL